MFTDGHSTHTKSIELINLARDNGVILLCFPPHCTHRLQPLDVGLMKPLSVYYDKEITNWLRNHPGEVVNLKHVAEIFGLAFAKAATMTTAMNSFKSTGIFPYNPDVFIDSDFIASETTNVEESHVNTLTIEPMPTIEVSQGVNELVNISDFQTVLNSVQNCTQTNNKMCTKKIVSGQTNLVSPITPVTKINTSFPQVSPTDVIPIPQQTYENKQKKKRNARAKGKTTILTDSPYKNELQQKQLNEKIKLIKKEKTVNRKLFKKPRTKKNLLEKLSDDDDDTECLYCGDTYMMSNEGWVQCVKCIKWAHCSCAGEDDNDDELNHICDICKQ